MAGCLLSLHPTHTPAAADCPWINEQTTCFEDKWLQIGGSQCLRISWEIPGAPPVPQALTRLVN